MSISKNTGGFSKYLSKLRTRKLYINSNKKAKNFIKKIPLGNKAIKLAEWSKKRIKGLFIAVSFMLALSFCRGLAFAHKNVAKAQSLDFDCNFICSDEKDTDNYVNYGCKELVEYTEE
jgi:hypothetical protein